MWCGPGTSEGEQATFSYYLDAHQTRVVDELGRTTTTRYHRNSLRPEAVTRPDGSEWKAEYDPIGRLLKTIDPLGREERYEYPEGSASPWPVVRVDAKGGRKALHWNRRGQLSAYTDCSGKTSRFEYDMFGHMVASTNALDQTTRIERLPTGQASTVELPDGSQERFEYDAAGLQVTHRDRAGHTRHWQRNARGQVMQATDAAGRQLDYRYDPQGRLVALASASGAYAFEYDSGDRLIQETRPDGVQRRLRHGAFGQALAQVDVGAGTNIERLMHFERDAAGRLLRHGTETSSTAYTWDDGDRLLKVEKRPTEAGKALGVNPSTVSFRHDKAGRLISEQGREGIVGYEFDELDHLAALNLPNEQRIAWLSYGSGHVHQVRCGEQVIADIERDDLHREVVRTQGRLTLGLGYDALGRRTWQSATRDPQALGPQQGQLWRTYRYSAEGELAEQNDSARGAWRFQYDPVGQLLQRARPDGRNGLEQFAWDAAGNLLDEVQRKSAGRVQGNRLTTWQDIRFDYDAWGNLKTKLSGARQTQHFVFDAENRLLAVRTEAAGGNTVETRFEYDALGRRIARHERQTEAGGMARHESTRRFVWQGLRMVQELRDSGLSNYVYSPDSPYTPMARVDAFIGAVVAGAAIEKAQQTSRVLHFHTDLVGAPLEVTDDQGELAWVGEYSTWGRVKPDGAHQLDARIEQPLRFPGQYADDSTGLHYNTFRYYDPDVGRFISQDPIGLRGGENLYAYAPNPTGWLDPWGWAGNPANATHITYEGVKNGKPYVGYASKPGLGHSAEDVLRYRYPNTGEFDIAPQPVYRGDGLEGKQVARGLEQRLFEQRGGLAGTSNLQNPVGPNNANRTAYLEAADRHLAAQNQAAKAKGTSSC